MRTSRPYTYLGTVSGMCRECRALVPCRVLAEGGAVYQERLCPTCGRSRARIAETVDTYLSILHHTVRCKEPSPPGTPVDRGCPWDCGPCSFHAAACHLPVFSVTNVCNMHCPICFTYNRPEAPYHMARDDLRRLLDHVVDRAAPLDLLNVTGGEPTMHPDILGLLAECRRPEIGRVTMNSNGLRIAEDLDLCRALAELGVYVILSFHTLCPDVSRRIHGRDVTACKLAALENLQRCGVGTTLLNCMIRGINDHEIGDVIRLAREHSVVRSITVQTMTYTGQGGGNFGPRVHMPCDAATAAIERATDGEMRREHFFPHPNAHPLCYSIAYYLRGQPFRSFTDFLCVDELRGMMGGYLLHADGDGEGTFRDAVDRLWAAGGDDPLLGRLKVLIGRLYPPGRPLSHFERQREDEEQILSVYVHAHMDEDTLDLARLVACPDQVPDPDGRMIPACAYNIFYRVQDARFYSPA